MHRDVTNLTTEDVLSLLKNAVDLQMIPFKPTDRPWLTVQRPKNHYILYFKKATTPHRTVRSESEVFVMKSFCQFVLTPSPRQYFAALREEKEKDIPLLLPFFSAFASFEGFGKFLISEILSDRKEIILNALRQWIAQCPHSLSDDEFPSLLTLIQCDLKV
jgi:hypothetical protein